MLHFLWQPWISNYCWIAVVSWCHQRRTHDSWKKVTNRQSAIKVWLETTFKAIQWCYINDFNTATLNNCNKITVWSAIVHIYSLHLFHLYHANTRLYNNTVVSSFTVSTYARKCLLSISNYYDKSWNVRNFFTFGLKHLENLGNLFENGSQLSVK